LFSVKESETWTVHPKIEKLKAQARAEGLWNLFLPVEADPTIKYVLLSLDLTQRRIR